MIIAYDVSDDKRRRKLFKLLGSFGVNVQYSFFEVAITRKNFVRLKAKIKNILKFPDDRIVFIEMCEDCWRKVVRWGYDAPYELKETVVL